MTAEDMTIERHNKSFRFYRQFCLQCRDCEWTKQIKAQTRTNNRRNHSNNTHLKDLKVNRVAFSHDGQRKNFMSHAEILFNNTQLQGDHFCTGNANTKDSGTFTHEGQEI
ncbi:hypothetical protein KUTeg_006533 [Tegillarca granosa]|uniref:Uncharacterized protein n=1 Tax=Tegillarca granosa TaxID=220873 RepID=A0ABQ9FF24_TEGGR|nr:hypothetical protein KUTeg_006533 [Tegillarca granosa]